MTRSFISLFLLGASFLIAPRSAGAAPITIPTVRVGNPGNDNDPLTGSLYGGVAYEYRIGTTEVTNAQYATFLNAKARQDPLALYNANMASDIRGGITRSGSGTVPDPYVYAVKPNMGNKPVNFVSWYDSIRFANWLHNGQGNGDTELGSYTLLGGNPTPTFGLSITRKPGATWFLPSENEWYKAAYHQPVADGGDADNYWLYPTVSNSVPTLAIPNAVGDVSNPGTNVANYVFGPGDGSLTTVGSAGPLSESFYGTSDQGGNLWEWNETMIFGGGVFRGLRGGAYFVFGVDGLQSGLRLSAVDPTLENDLIGFRVAFVPEPSTAVLGVVGCALVWALRKRFK